MASMKQKLKPCPFCGGSPVIVGTDIDYYAAGELSVFIHCGTCQASAPGEGYLTRAHAVACWNYRYNEESPRERFCREYRDARMIANIAPKQVNRNPISLVADWGDSIKNQCAPAVVYALLSVDKMADCLPIKTRLGIYRLRKWGFSK